MIFPYKPWSALLRSPRWKIFVPLSDWYQFVKIAQVASSFSSFKKNDKYFLFLGNWKDVGHNTHCWHWESCKYFLDHLKLASCGETVLLFHQLLSPSCRDKMYFTVTSLLSTFCLAPHWSIDSILASYWWTCLPQCPLMSTYLSQFCQGQASL